MEGAIKTIIKRYKDTIALIDPKENETCKAQWETLREVVKDLEAIIKQKKIKDNDL